MEESLLLVFEYQLIFFSLFSRLKCQKQFICRYILHKFVISCSCTYNVNKYFQQKLNAFHEYIKRQPMYQFKVFFFSFCAFFSIHNMKSSAWSSFVLLFVLFAVMPCIHHLQDWPFGFCYYHCFLWSTIQQQLGHIAKFYLLFI